MMKPDLHMHSNFSDGVLTPLQLLEKAASLGVTVAAITDHDTFDGVEALKGADAPVPVIPGVELSLRDMHGLHLLGYGREVSGALRDTVAQLAHKRANRARLMVKRLAELGMSLDWDAMTAGYAGTVGRAHIARAMLAKGYVQTMQEAFERYIGENGPAYVAGERLSMAEALPLMRSCGFVPMLAHPKQLNKDSVTLRMLLEHWKAQGLMGVEVYHPSQAGQEAPLERMVRSMGLMVTGGSDFHKEGDNHGILGSTAAGWVNAQQDVERLLEAIG